MSVSCFTASDHDEVQYYGVVYNLVLTIIIVNVTVLLFSIFVVVVVSVFIIQVINNACHKTAMIGHVYILFYVVTHLDYHLHLCCTKHD